MTTKNKSQEKHKMSEIDDHILKYFDIRKRLGKGAYGIVWKAIDKKSSQTVAVKKIFDAFRDETDAQRTFREIMFLRAFRNHPNIIQLHNVYRATNNLDIYLSFEFMESDLHNVIKKGNILKDVHKRYIMYQLLNAIKYIHSGNVIHRDLKPSNVLIDTKCKCKLADFGLARSVSNQQVRDTASDACENLEPVLTDYVATRWYRAPEILVASKKYTKGIDMWSLGCILGEMIRGKPIFQGSSTVNQIEKIVSALPEITEKDVLAVGAGFGTALLNKQVSNTSSTTTLDELLIDGTSDASNLVKRLLVLDPLARLTANEALSHRYVEKFRHSIQELELDVDVQPPFRDDVRLSVTEYRSKLYEITLQTEKANNAGKIPVCNRRRDPRQNNKSVDSIPAKLNQNEDKHRRNAYRPQERKSCIPNPCANTSTSTKVTVKNSTNKVHIVASSPSNNGTIPKTQSIINLTSEQNSTDAKAATLLSKTKYVIKSTIKHVQPTAAGGAKNTISSPEISNTQHPPSKLNRYMMEKRHSIDGSYHYEAPSSTTTYHDNQLAAKDRRTNMLHNSYGSINRQSESKSKIPSSRPRRSSQNIFYSSQCNTTEAPPPEPKDLHVRRSDTNKYDERSNLHDGSTYYEKRLRRLEEEIEKHKRDIKAFCSENTKQSKSMTFTRNPEQEHRIQYRDKYSMVSTGSGKGLQLRSKVSNGSYKHPTRHGSTSGFEYLYAGGDDVDHRQEMPAKYDDRKTSFK